MNNAEVQTLDDWVSMTRRKAQQGLDKDEERSGVTVKEKGKWLEKQLMLVRICRDYFLAGWR